MHPNQSRCSGVLSAVVSMPLEGPNSSRRSQIPAIYLRYRLSQPCDKLGIVLENNSKQTRHLTQAPSCQKSRPNGKNICFSCPHLLVGFPAAWPPAPNPSCPLPPRPARPISEPPGPLRAAAAYSPRPPLALGHRHQLGCLLRPLNHLSREKDGTCCAGDWDGSVPRCRSNGIRRASDPKLLSRKILRQDRRTAR